MRIAFVLAACVASCCGEASAQRVVCVNGVCQMVSGSAPEAAPLVSYRLSRPRYDFDGNGVADPPLRQAFPRLGRAAALRDLNQAANIAAAQNKVSMVSYPVVSQVSVPTVASAPVVQSQVYSQPSYGCVDCGQPEVVHQNYSNQGYVTYGSSGDCGCGCNCEGCTCASAGVSAEAGVSYSSGGDGQLFGRKPARRLVKGVFKLVFGRRNR